MKIKFDVTAADIKGGVKSTASMCPLALALKRFLRGKNIQKVTVGTQTVTMLRGDEKGFVQCADLFGSTGMPAEMRVFVNSFDTGKPVKAQTFEADVPEQITWRDGFGYVSNESL